MLDYLVDFEKDMNLIWKQKLTKTLNSYICCKNINTTQNCRKQCERHINCSKAHIHTKQEEISMVSMSNTVIYPC